MTASICNKCSAKCTILQSKIYIKKIYLPTFSAHLYSPATKSGHCNSYSCVAQFFCEYILF